MVAAVGRRQNCRHLPPMSPQRHRVAKVSPERGRAASNRQRHRSSSPRAAVVSAPAHVTSAVIAGGGQAAATIGQRPKPARGQGLRMWRARSRRAEHGQGRGETEEAQRKGWDVSVWGVWWRWARVEDLRGASCRLAPRNRPLQLSNSVSLNFDQPANMLIVFQLTTMSHFLASHWPPSRSNRL